MRMIAGQLRDILPTSSGISAPPTIAVQSSPDVASTLAEDRSSVIVKITGNMIELNRPIAQSDEAGA